MKTASLALLLATVGIASNAAAAWPRLPSSGSQPVDLASNAIPGTVVSGSQGIGQPQTLLASDPVAGATVPVGASEVVISLAKQYTIDTTRFLNDGAEGKVTISGSADNAKWTSLGQASFTASDRSVPVSFAGAQVKYLKVAFQASKNGVIRSFSAFGATKAKDFHLKFSEGSNATTINLADGVGGARAIYAFPTPTNAGEKEAATNVFHFPPTKEKYRTVVYDLTAPRKVKQFTATYSATPVRLEVFALDQLGEKNDWRGKLTFDPATLDSATPVAVGEDARGLGNIKLTPSKAVQARYVVLRFEPGYTGTASVGGSFSDFMAFAALPLHGFVQREGSSRFTAGGNGGFSMLGVGIESSSAGNFESSGNEQGDEESDSEEEEGSQTDKEDEQALYNQFGGNYGAFNMMTGSRGSSGGGAGSAEGSGSDGGTGSSGGGSGDGPDITINPTNPSTTPPPDTSI